MRLLRELSRIFDFDGCTSYYPLQARVNTWPHQAGTTAGFDSVFARANKDFYIMGAEPKSRATWRHFHWLFFHDGWTFCRYRNCRNASNAAKFSISLLFFFCWFFFVCCFSCFYPFLLHSLRAFNLCVHKFRNGLLVFGVATAKRENGAVRGKEMACGNKCPLAAASTRTTRTATTTGR